MAWIGTVFGVGGVEQDPQVKREASRAAVAAENAIAEDNLTTKKLNAEARAEAEDIVAETKRVKLAFCQRPLRGRGKKKNRCKKSFVVEGGGDELFCEQEACQKYKVYHYKVKDWVEDHPTDTLVNGRFVRAPTPPKLFEYSRGVKRKGEADLDEFDDEEDGPPTYQRSRSRSRQPSVPPAFIVDDDAPF